MQDFTGKIAVITGAASGIGRALAAKAGEEGMGLVIADIDPQALQQLANQLSDTGVEVLCQVSDVSNYDSVQALADAAYKRFGRVDILFNNAGVLLSGFCWERSLQDWQRIIGVNFWGVLHGIKAFVPRMIEQSGDGHIVNTSSLAGLLASPLMGPYTVGKQAVVALAETLHYELAMINSSLKVSVVCPGPVATDIAHSDTSAGGGASLPEDSAQKNLQDFLSAGIAAGMSAQQCADIVFQGIRRQQFWIFTHEDFKDSYRDRVDSVFNNTNPVYQAYETEE